MNINIDYIKQLADAMDEKSIVELALEDNGQKISLKKGAVAHAEAIVPVTEQVASPVIEEQPAETHQRGGRQQGRSAVKSKLPSEGWGDHLCQLSGPGGAGDRRGGYPAGYPV